MWGDEILKKDCDTTFDKGSGEYQYWLGQRHEQKYQHLSYQILYFNMAEKNNLFLFTKKNWNQGHDIMFFVYTIDNQIWLKPRNISISHASEQRIKKRHNHSF